MTGNHNREDGSQSSKATYCFALIVQRTFSSSADSPVICKVSKEYLSIAPWRYQQIPLLQRDCASMHFTSELY